MADKHESRFSKLTRSSNKERSEIDACYFGNYSDITIHQEMLNDTVRMESYQRALAEVAGGKIVIDVGAGTGVLSIMAVN